MNTYPEKAWIGLGFWYNRQGGEMIRIDVTGIDSAARRMGVVANQIPFAASNALNAVAFKARTGLQEEMKSSLDRPKPWTVKQVRVKKSTKRNLEAIVGSPQAVAGKSGILDQILGPHIRGTQRRSKPIESRLRAIGLMPSGYYAIPASGTRRDRYGNMTRAAWRKLLRTNQERKLFSALPDQPKTAHLAPGIYERVNRRRIRPLVVFVPMAPKYGKRLPWSETAHEIVRAEFGSEFAVAYRRALASAR